MITTSVSNKHQIIACLLILISTNLSAQINGLNFNFNFISETVKDVWYNPAIVNGLHSTAVSKSIETTSSYAPSFAYLRFTKIDNFHIFEVARISFQHHNSATKVKEPNQNYLLILNGTETYEMRVSARYCYNHRMGSNERFQPFIGLGISPQFQRTVIEPKVSSFKSSVNDFGADFEIIGSALIRLSDKMKFNISVPINVFNYTYERTRTDNPMIPQKDQPQDHLKKEFFPLRFELKMGIIYILSKKEDKTK